MSSSKTQTQTTPTQSIQQSSPYAYIKPALNTINSQADNMMASGELSPNYTPWSQVAALNPLLQQNLLSQAEYFNNPNVLNTINSIQKQNDVYLNPNINPYTELSQYVTPSVQEYSTVNDSANVSGGINRLLGSNTQDAFLNQMLKKGIDISNESFKNLSEKIQNQEGIGNKIAAPAFNSALSSQLNQSLSEAYKNQNQNRLSAIDLANQNKQNQMNIAKNVLMNQNNFTNAINQQNIQAQEQSALLPLKLLQSQWNVGKQLNDYQQKLIDDATARWMFEQNAPQVALNNYQKLTQPSSNWNMNINQGQQTSAQQSSGSSKLAGVGSGALSGAMMGGQLGGGVGAGVGAGIGGLLGLLG